MKKTLIATLVTAFMTGAYAQEAGVTSTEIRLGAILPMSGAASFPGIGAELGTRLAIIEFNDAGGAAGRKVKLLVEDDGYQPNRAYQGLTKLLDTGIIALVGTSGAASLAAVLPMIDEKKILTMVSTSASKAAVTPARPYIFMIGADYEDLFFAQIKYIKENDKPTGPYAIIRQDDDYGALVEEGFKRAVKELNLASVEPIRFKRGQKDFSAEVLKLRSQNVGSISIGGVIAETPGVLKDLAKFKMNIPTANPHTGNIDMTLKLSAPFGLTYYAADYMATIGSDGGSDLRRFAAKHLTTDEQTKMNRFTISGYLGTKAVLNGIRQCASTLTRTCVAEKIKATKSLNVGGLASPLDFSGPRNTAATTVQVVKVNPMEGTIKPLTGFVAY